MAYKKIERRFPFADIAVKKFAEKNRSMLFLHQVNNTMRALHNLIKIHQFDDFL